MPIHWYALHVKPHKERMVNDGLNAKNVDAYYPVLKKEPSYPGGKKEQPFFPGYIFVHLDLEILGNNALKWLEGTHGLVAFGGEPAAVPDLLIEALKHQINDLDLIAESPGEILRRGDSVRIVEGPFDGYEAIFDSHLAANDRIQVMLTFLRAQPKKLQLQSSEIVKIEP